MNPGTFGSFVNGTACARCGTSRPGQSMVLNGTAPGWTCFPSCPFATPSPPPTLSRTVDDYLRFANNVTAVALIAIGALLTVGGEFDAARECLVYGVFQRLIVLHLWKSDAK